MSIKHYTLKIHPEMDSPLVGEYVLSDRDADLIKRVLDGLKPMGDWPPYIAFECKEDLEEMKRRIEERLEKEKAEEEKEYAEKMAKATGNDKKFPTAFELAFKQAMNKKES